MKPTIMTVGELLRIGSSLRDSQLRDNVLAYAETIRTTYQLRPDIYYYRRCEEIESVRYDTNRIAKVCEIYHSGNARRRRYSKRVAEIAAGYDKKNVVNIHFYCRLLRFDLCRGKYHDHGQLQIDRIKDYIRSVFRQLTDYQQKLYENRSDLICTAIRSNDINYDEAYELALFAATELSERWACVYREFSLYLVGELPRYKSDNG